MNFNSKLRAFLISLALLTCILLAVMAYYQCVPYACHGSFPRWRVNTPSSQPKSLIPPVDNFIYGEKEYHFDTRAKDVIVFLHMQKTGGTQFGHHLVKNLNVENPCRCPHKRKRCHCKRPNSNKLWLFSRYSTGWLCGLHADWTELQACVPTLMNKMEGKDRNRRFLFVTILREPVARYVSEFLCYKRGTTWRAALHMCNGRRPSKTELPPCYSGENWMDVTLDKFMACSSNLANNRQTRMMADLRLVGCYNTSAMPLLEREETLIESAKRNLESMAYFALTEYQIESQFLFEKTFGIKFIRPFTQTNTEETRSGEVALDSLTVDRIKELVSLDIKLYSFAKDLFFKRLKYFKYKNSPLVGNDSYLFK